MEDAKIFGYRLAWGPGDFCFYSPKNYELEINKEGADVWELYDHPQENCSPLIAVYYKGIWIEPKYVFKRDMSGFTPLYLGPLINEMKIDESVAFAFPGLMEERLKQNRPELFRK